ncbi:tRNA ligase Trl1 [Schizosaccharomyces octosporus yFS286]|uniref:tRNA ligase n=1 Tax=Schizosaccharomyces octosporus (strain yFS286) TaxID=483514 RepID=S9PRS9_SCHOY|nr:tRNA ligase Trl1 [Schizosaccharomyces octosporus yFS286]EPX70677.1 tRNA ligase Trl1 [Schizosaccharomyces octosporus yFS286]
MSNTFATPKELVEELCRLRDLKIGIFGEKKPTIRSVSFAVPGTKYELTSWRVWEQAYRINVSDSKKTYDSVTGQKRRLPTCARGLFTYKDPNSEEQKIAIRGYDKFFNIDEIPLTTWKSMKEHTRGPYELTVKENGCIIFISALSNGELIITSKHSFGAVEGQSVSHALAGERWLETHLQKVGKSKKELAQELLKRQATAVAELCDDEFEEHILPYRAEYRGLYLHGLNLNVPEFTTASSEDVSTFAKVWGFLKTDSFHIQKFEEMKNFLEETAKTGKWNNRSVEGFVVRCHSTVQAKEHKPTNDFFFKYKFDEPYGMFRQWREVTKMLIHDKPLNYVKYKKITNEYVNFCRKKFQEKPELKVLYLNNKGIISLREEFLLLSKLDAMTISVESSNEKPYTLLVPIATIGCGKTTVAKILERLFNWPVVQNDNIPSGKGGPKRFAHAIVNEFQNGHSIVFSDRNNHIPNMRSALRNDVSSELGGVRYIALPFLQNSNTRSFVQKRIINRGDRHQSIKVSEGVEKVDAILNMFYKQYRPFDPELFSHDQGYDDVVELDAHAGSLENARLIVDYIREHMPDLVPQNPSEEEYQQALEYAVNEYVPTYTKNMGGSSLKKKENFDGINYFGVCFPSEKVNNVLKEIISSKGISWNDMFASYTLQESFHVTMIHNSQIAFGPETANLWQQYLNQLENKHDGNNQVNFTIRNLVWDGRIMCFAVDIDSKSVWCGKTVNPQLHITLGTTSPSVKAYDSNLMLERLRAGKASDEPKIHVLDVEPKVNIMGTLQSVPKK